MRSVAWAVVFAAAALSMAIPATGQTSVEGVSVVIVAPGDDPVVPLGGSVNLTVEVTTECVDEDLQPMTETEVGISWSRPAPYVTVNGSQVADSHEKDAVACASGSDDITSSLTFMVSLAPDAPGFEAFEVAVTAVMNKTTLTGTTTQYGPAVGNITLFSGFRPGLHVTEVASDTAVKPGNETTLKLRVFNMANAAARVTIEEVSRSAGNNSSRTMRVLSLPEPLTLAAAVEDSEGARADVEILLQAPDEVPGPGYHPANVTLRFVTETQTPNGTATTKTFEQTFTRHVGGLKVDVYSDGPTTISVGVAATVALVAFAASARRK